jgi:hypothetical protein
MSSETSKLHARVFICLERFSWRLNVLSHWVQWNEFTAGGVLVDLADEPGDRLFEGDRPMLDISSSNIMDEHGVWALEEDMSRDD